MQEQSQTYRLYILQSEKEFYEELLQREEVRDSFDLGNEFRIELDKINRKINEHQGYGKVGIEINLGKTPVELENRLMKFTKEDRFNHFQVRLIRKGNDKERVYLTHLNPVSGKVNFCNGFAVEHNSFTEEFNRIVCDIFKLDWFCE